MTTSSSPAPGGAAGGGKAPPLQAESGRANVPGYSSSKFAYFAISFFFPALSKKTVIFA